MASLLGGSDEDQIVLTSGATEANAWVFYSVPARGHIVTSSIEHSSIIAVSERARVLGHPVDVAEVDETGLISLDGLSEVLRPDTRLVSLQLANNETGAVQPLAKIAKVVRSIAPDARIHTDATQAVGRVTLDLTQELAEVDLLSFSGHKFHGPKGIGGLFIRCVIELYTLIPGEQEHGKRGGTSNVPAAAGLAVAARRAKLALASMTTVTALRNALEALLSAMVPSAQINAEGVRRLPNTSSVTLPGVDANDVVEQLALQGICIATGSACNAGASAPSHVLTAMGLTAAKARSTLRFSLSSETVRADIDETVTAMRSFLSEHALSSYHK